MHVFALNNMLFNIKHYICSVFFMVLDFKVNWRASRRETFRSRIFYAGLYRS